MKPTPVVWSRALTVLLFVVVIGGRSSVTAWTTTTTTTTKRRPTSLRLAPQQLGNFETLDIIISSEDDHYNDDDDTVARRIVRLERYVSSSQPNEQAQQPVLIPYHQGWERQQELWQRHANSIDTNNHHVNNDSSAKTTKNTATTGSGCSSSSNPCHNDVILMLQHEPIYTLGTASDESFIHNNNDNAIPVQRINRGGEVTYHGPGQLTVYPVLDLRHYRRDIHWYVRALEEVVIVALRSLGIADAGRDADTTGVWVRGHKVAAIGVHARRWITQHGFAINVTPESLVAFDGIVPCGLHGRKVGCVQQFIVNDSDNNTSTTTNDNDDNNNDNRINNNAKPITMEEVADAVAMAFEKVFCVKLETE